MTRLKVKPQLPVSVTGSPSSYHPWIGRSKLRLSTGRSCERTVTIYAVPSSTTNAWSHACVVRPVGA